MEKARLAEPRARVFISCGQNKNSDEVSIASDIKQRLTELGFDPYIAVEEQTLRGLKENIFGQLSNSEYFVFVDFKREVLGSSNPSVHRGSLFCHQELALASFLDLEVLALQEDGVKQDDGILRFLQGNAIPFSDRHLLPSVIADKVRSREWNPNWRNELAILRNPEQFHDARQIVNNSALRWARFFHVDVQNRHRTKTASNCYVYLEKATQLDSSAEIALKPIEFKWAGYTLPYVHIPPQRNRQFDAILVSHDTPDIAEFNVYSDATDYIPRLPGKGRYKLTYLAVSDNFPPVRCSLVLELDSELARVKLIPNT